MLRGYNTTDSHLATIEKLLENFDITKDTYKRLAELYHRVANNYFNRRFYDKAAEYYVKGIEQLETKYRYDQNLNNPLFNDKDFRALTELYIDLSDALNNLNQSESAYFAFNQAINAFGCVTDDAKTAEEKTLLNLNDNFVAFRNHIEAITSQPGYLSTDEYHSNGQKIKTNCEVEAINAQLCNAILGENQRNDANDLCNSLNILSLFHYTAGHNASYLQPVMLKPRAEEEIHDDEDPTPKTPPLPRYF